MEGRIIPAPSTQFGPSPAMRVFIARLDTFVDIYPQPKTGKIEIDALFATRSPVLVAKLLPGEIHQISEVAHDLAGAEND